MGKKISVIVPAYNASATIEKCLDSMRKQTYGNIEIVVVNDGSTDDTKEILKKIANDDSRVRVISIKNGGVSHARNVGIDNATGDYITFVDADDTIECEMYAHLMGLIDKYNVEIAHCSYKNYDGNRLLSSVGNSGKEIVQNHNEALTCLLSGKYFAGSLCNKLYKSQLFEGIRLDENIKYNEDVLMNFQLFEKTNKSVYTDLPFYNYIANDSSSTHSSNAVFSGEQTLSVAEKIAKLSIGKPYENVAKKRLAYTSLCLYRAYLFENSGSLKDKKRRLLQNLKMFLQDGCYTERKDKATLWMYRFVPGFYKIAYRLYDKIRVKKLDPEQ